MKAWAGVGEIHGIVKQPRAGNSRAVTPPKPERVKGMGAWGLKSGRRKSCRDNCPTRNRSPQLQDTGNLRQPVGRKPEK